MTMDDVELLAPAVRFREHARFERAGIEPRIGSCRSWRHRLEIGCSLGICSREQRDVVSESDQLFGEVGNHSLGAAVAFRGNGFCQWRDLGDAHCSYENRRDRRLSREAAVTPLGPAFLPAPATTMHGPSIATSRRASRGEDATVGKSSRRQRRAAERFVDLAG
jgi:hypothetical protein